MVVFCSDLDNTLIYSYKHDIGEHKVLVERMEGKDLSYMTVKAHKLLKKIAEIHCLVPVTTRSLQQYERIDFGAEVPIPYALVANGGILLENGKRNEEWFAETKQMVQNVDEELKKGIAFLKKDPEICFEIRKVDELFIFTKSNNAKETIWYLKKNLDTKKVYIDSNGSKVYIFPKELNKGHSLKRFKNYLKKDSIVLAAGDSEFDIPMLEHADIGLCLETLNIQKQSVRKYQKQQFTEAMLQYVLEFNRDRSGLASCENKR